MYIHQQKKTQQNAKFIAQSENQCNNHRNSTITLRCQNNLPIIQRMAIFDGPKIPVDMSIINSLGKVEAQAGSPLHNNNDAYSYKGVDKIGILAHGRPGAICWKGNPLSGKQFAESELCAHQIESGTTVYIWSCGAGENQLESSPDNSLCDNVAHSLSANSIYNVNVQGVTGSTHTVIGEKHYKYKLDNEANRAAAKEANLKHLKESRFFPVAVHKEPPQNLFTYLRNITLLKEKEDAATKALTYPQYIEQKKIQFNLATTSLLQDDATMALFDEVASSEWYTATSKIPEPTEDL